MNKPLETPFEFLRRKCNELGKNTGKGEKYDSIIINNWYKARAYILNKLNNVCINPNGNKHLHFVIEGDNPLMLSVVRQIALYAHFANYDEDSRINRTVVTIVSNNGETVINDLKKEEYLCNLLNHCKYTVNNNTANENSFIDLEFVITNERPKIDKNKELEMIIIEDDVINYCNTKNEKEIYYIDTSKAQYADKMYCLGTEIENLPYNDIHSIERYSLALDVFLYTRLGEPLGRIVDTMKWECEQNQVNVLNALSNIFCSDCFITRYNSIRFCWENGNMTEKQAMETYYDVLSRSEHSRWVVEKLILGYKPMNTQQRIEYESLFDNNKKQYAKKIKKDVYGELSHIDLCSFAELRRIDPDNMKYDSFLMLGIPEILRKVGEI